MMASEEEDILLPGSPPATRNARGVLRRLYISHTLSTWNSRTFEFGAVLFLASVFPGTLFYASCYALFRAAAAALLSSYVGGWVDRWDRLRSVRHSIVWQRVPVAVSCLAFAVLSAAERAPLLVWACFSASVVLGCAEKLASVANTVAVERDWIIVVATDVGVEREDLNAVMRRIDLLAKLLAPVFISLIDEYSSIAAIWVVFGQNAISVLVEYFAIAQVYQTVAGLQGLDRSGLRSTNSDGAPYALNAQENQPSSAPSLLSKLSTSFGQLLEPWAEYVRNPAFLASFSLSLVYFTVLSTGVQMQTYLFTLGFTSIEVSIMRLAAVAIELLATWVAPIMMRKIGPVRSGLWFINEQLACIAVSAALFLSAPAGTRTAGYSLIVGITFSRLGLWGFDLSVQYLVQENTPELSRGKFSAAEMALQNVAELLSFATTMVFSRPEDFRYPVIVSVAAVAVSASCFACFVRKRRGHLLHASKCFKRDRYTAIPQAESNDEESQQRGTS